MPFKTTPCPRICVHRSTCASCLFLAISFCFCLLPSFLCLLMLPYEALAEDIPIAKISGILGRCYVLRGADKITAEKGQQLFNSDQMVTSPKSLLKVTFADGSETVVQENSSVEVSEFRSVMNGEKLTLKSVIELVKGKARFYFKPRPGGHDAKVKNVNGVFGIRGTEFVLDNTDAAVTRLQVLAGQVAVEPTARQTSLGEGPSNTRPPVLVDKGYSAEIASEKPVSKPKPLTKNEIQNAEQSFIVPGALATAEAQDGLALPPPTFLPRPPQQKEDTDSVLRSDAQLKALQAQRFMILPLGAVAITRTSVQCDSDSLGRFRLAAQSLDTTAVTLGRELALCPGIRDEALFWLAFYHLARGELQDAAGVWRFGAETEAPLDARSPRDRFLERARNGQTYELEQLVQKNDPLVKGDTAALFTLARAHARVARWGQSEGSYKQLFQDTKTLSGPTDASIEWAFTLLLQGRVAQAETAFAEIRQKNLTTTQRASADLGFKWAQERGATPGFPPSQLGLFLTTQSNHLGLGLKTVGVFWKSPLIDVTLGSQQVDLREPSSAANGPTQSNKTSNFSASVLAKTTLSSGFLLRIGTGYFGQSKGLVTAQADLEKSFLLPTLLPATWQPRVVMGFARTPAASPTLAEEDRALPPSTKTLFTPLSTLRVGTVWGDELLGYTLAWASLANGPSWITQDLWFTYGLHRNPSTQRRLDLLGFVTHTSSSDVQKDLVFVPQTETHLRGGARYEENFWGNLGIEARYLTGFLNRKASGDQQTSSNFNNNGTSTASPSDTVDERMGIDFELTQEMALGIQYQWQQWVARLKVCHREGNTKTGTKASQTDHVEATVHWQWR